MNLRRNGLILAPSLALPAAAGAAPYWVAWEGNDFPENEGWTRFHGPSGREALRTIADGMMTYDSLFDNQVFDFSRITMPGAFTLGPGETFVAEWRLLVEASEGQTFDQTLGLFTGDDWGLGFEFGVGGFASMSEHTEFVYSEQVLHTYKLSTSNFRQYHLVIDSSQTIEGDYWEPAVTRSEFGWGDGVQGAASRATWDYVRFGIVPEPVPAAVYAVAALMILHKRIGSNQ